MVNQWSNYLYQEHSAVAVSPLKTLNLLDVLIKTDRQGFTTPVLEKVGSMVTLGRQGQEFTETQERLRDGLESFQRTGVGAQGDETLFRCNHSIPDINVNLKSSTSVIGSLLIVFGDANLQFRNAKHLKCSLKRVKTAGVDKEELTEIISEEMWKPDINKRILKWPPAGRFSKGGRELWVITEILYAEKLTVASADSNSMGGGAHTSGPALLALGVPGPVGGQIEASTTQGDSLDFIAQDKKPFMFAYRAICAQYDSAGGYVNHKLNAGKRPPVTRYRKSGDNSSSQMHLEGLFRNLPAGDQQDDEDLQCLEIVNAVDNDNNDD
ncbi:unnamed protein product [Sphagnum compactum]